MAEARCWLHAVGSCVRSLSASRQKFASLVRLFRKYGSQYEMDWMLMAAQGYQESRLDHAARSRAGVKYIRSMVDRYYVASRWTLNKVLFAFAAYNTDPGRVRQLRREAAERGLDRNVWFDNVERLASERRDLKRTAAPGGPAAGQ